MTIIERLWSVSIRVSKNCSWMLFCYPLFFLVFMGKYHGFLVPFRFLRWHGGAQTLLMTSGTNKYFIKIDSDHARINNEVHWGTFLYDKNPLYFCRIVESFELISRRIVMFEYFESRSFDSLDLGLVSDKCRLKLMDQLVQISDILFDNGVIHRDISPGNLLVRTAGDDLTLKLVDLAYAIPKDYSSRPDNGGANVEATLGQDWRPEDYVWDDSYAILEIAKSIGGDQVEGLSSYLEALESKVGRLRYSSITFSDQKSAQC